MHRFLFIFAILFAFPIFAGQGDVLEKQMWEAMKSKDWTFVDQHIAADFQSIHEDGARTRQQEIELIKNLDLGNYTISEIQVTEGSDIIVISYKVATEETIEGKKLSPAPSYRLSVWRKNPKGIWQWIAHANLNPIHS